MKIIIAKNAGYCFGVRRAVKMAEEVLDSNEGKPVYCLGSLIHNPQAIAKLQEKGFQVVKSLDEIPNDSIFIVRSHGTAREIEKKAIKKNLKIVDTTCPFVKKAQKTAQNLYEEGRKVVICGDPNHAEVIGINSYTDNLAIIIQQPEELENLESKSKIGVLAQTTQKKEKFDAIIAKLKKEIKDVKTENTICSATSIKQNEVRDLAKKVDLMIVVGGKESSNTTKLAQIAKEEVKTFHIETADEIKNQWLKGVETIGIAAGASTPDFSIREVKKKLENFTK